MKATLISITIFQLLLFFTIELGVNKGIIRNDLMAILLKVSCCISIQFSLMPLIK